VEIDSLVEAIKKNNPQEINRWSEKAREVLIGYLRARFGASYDDAQDSVHETLAMVVEKIRENRFTTDNPGGYILTSARNEYFRIYHANKNKVSDEVLDYRAKDPVSNPHELVDEDTVGFLRKCITKLNDASRSFIEFILTNPDAKAEDVAEEFGTSTGNVWTRKHRIGQKLLECINGMKSPV